MVGAFSVIIPVYNAELFLAESIDSVLSQTYGGFELILVDDGSTDDSGRICEKYLHRDCRIRVIHQDNRGQTAARLTGIVASENEFCLFLDADDRWKPELLMIVQNEIAAHNCDMILYDYVMFDNDHTYSADPILPQPCVLAEGRLSVLWRKYALENTMNSLCTKAIRRSCIPISEIAAQPRFRTSEDMLMGMSILLQVRSVAYVQQALYEYRQHQSSVIHQFDVQKLDDIVQSRKYARDLVKIAGISDDILAKGFDTHCALVLGSCLRTMIFSNMPINKQNQVFRSLMNRPDVRDILKGVSCKEQSIQNTIRIICYKWKCFPLLVCLEKAITFYKTVRGNRYGWK